MADEGNNTGPDSVASEPSVLDGIGAAFNDSPLTLEMGPAGLLEFAAPEAPEVAAAPAEGKDAPENPEASGGTEPATEPVAAQPAEPPADVVPKDQYDNLRSMNDRRFNELKDKYSALEAKLEAALDSGDGDDDFDDDPAYDDDDDEDPRGGLSTKERTLLQAAESREQVANEVVALQMRVREGEIAPEQLQNAFPYMDLEFKLADKRGYDISMSDAYDAAIEQYNRFGPLRSADAAAGNNGGQPGIPQGTTPAPVSKPVAPQENAEALRERAARLQTETSVSVAGEDTFRNSGKQAPIKTIDDAMAAAWKEMTASR